MMPSPWSDTTASAYYNHPAYTSVQVRQNFGAPAPNPYGYPAPPPPLPVAAPVAPQPPQQDASGNIQWPDNLRNYVQRVFLDANDDASIPRAEVEVRLRQIISSAKANGQIFTSNWDMMPLPQQVIRDERLAFARAAQLSINFVPPAVPNIHSAYVHSPSPPTPAIATPSPTSSKRKQQEEARWKTAGSDSHKTLKSRITKSEKRHSKNEDDTFSKPSKLAKNAERETRARRFELDARNHRRTPTPPPCDGPIVGTCEDLEKRYLRLTAPPVPCKVRPERVLRKTLDLLKQKWRAEGNYGYICDQFKSLRQDLTVQRIRNEFTVSVYEIHARIALEKGDLGEYNQCQSQLKVLYSLGIKGNPVEFQAYRILYFIHTANRTGLNETIAKLTPQDKMTIPIKHALEVRSALALGNYHKFFRLYLDTPGMGGYLMDMFVGRERLAALCMICKAYKPSVKIRFITEELGFDSDAEACQFIIDNHGQHLLDDSSANEVMFLTGKAGTLFMDAKQAAFRSVDIKGQI